MSSSSRYRDAHVEAESFHICASEVGAQTRPLETALEVALLRGVTQARQSDVEPLRAEPTKEAGDVPGTSHRHDRDALFIKIPAAAPGQRFERELVAHAFDKHDRACDLHAQQGNDSLSLRR